MYPIFSAGSQLNCIFMTLWKYRHYQLFMNVKYMELSKQWKDNSLILTLTYQGSITSYLLKIASIAVHVISAFVTSNSIICTIAELSLSFDGVLFQSSVCTIDSFYVCSKTFSCCFWLSLRLARRVTKEICLGLMHVEFFVIVLTCFVLLKHHVGIFVEKFPHSCRRMQEMVLCRFRSLMFCIFQFARLKYSKYLHFLYFLMCEQLKL